MCSIKIHSIFFLDLKEHHEKEAKQKEELVTVNENLTDDIARMRRGYITLSHIIIVFLIICSMVYSGHLQLVIRF